MSECPHCGWRGIPTYLKGERQDKCPSCKKEKLAHPE
jgi:hypothetical protein